MAIMEPTLFGVEVRLLPKATKIRLLKEMAALSMPMAVEGKEDESWYSWQPERAPKGNSWDAAGSSRGWQVVGSEPMGPQSPGRGAMRSGEIPLIPAKGRANSTTDVSWDVPEKAGNVDGWKADWNTQHHGPLSLHLRGALSRLASLPTPSGRLRLRLPAGRGTSRVPWSRKSACESNLAGCHKPPQPERLCLLLQCSRHPRE
eukprot:s2640_g4.t1